MKSRTVGFALPLTLSDAVADGLHAGEAGELGVVNGSSSSLVAKSKLSASDSSDSASISSGSFSITAILSSASALVARRRTCTTRRR